MVHRRRHRAGRRPASRGQPRDARLARTQRPPLERGYVWSSTTAQARASSTDPSAAERNDSRLLRPAGVERRPVRDWRAGHHQPRRFRRASSGEGRASGFALAGRRRSNEFLLACGLDDAYQQARAESDQDWDAATTLRSADPAPARPECPGRLPGQRPGQECGDGSTAARLARDQTSRVKIERGPGPARSVPPAPAGHSAAIIPSVSTTTAQLARPPRFDGPSRPAAVLILIYADEHGDARLILTERAGGGHRHAGQISLPGGAIDRGDASPRPPRCARRARRSGSTRSRPACR